MGRNRHPLQPRCRGGCAGQAPGLGNTGDAARGAWQGGWRGQRWFWRWSCTTFLYSALNEPRAAARGTAGAAKLALKAGGQPQGGLHLWRTVPDSPAENHPTPTASPGESPGGVDGLSCSKNWLRKREGFQSSFWGGSPRSPSCDSQSLSSRTLCRPSWRCSSSLRVICSLVQRCNSDERAPP